MQFDAHTNRGQQSLAVIDLIAKPSPAVVQNVYFPAPQSACVGAVFSPPADDGSADFFVSGGFENKVWRFRFTPGAPVPLSPPSSGPDTKVLATSIDLAPLADAPPAKRYNAGQAAVYPLGLALFGPYLFAADNLDDSVGIVHDPANIHPLRRVDLRLRPDENVYPYAVAVQPIRPANGTDAVKVYVSLWNAASVATFEWPPVDTLTSGHPDQTTVARIPTGSHPTALLMDAPRHRLYVANSNADSVSVIDTDADREIERISVRLTDDALPGVSPEGLALSGDGGTLYVANAHADAVAVVHLGDRVRGQNPPEGKEAAPSRMTGLIPTGRYPERVCPWWATRCSSATARGRAQKIPLTPSTFPTATPTRRTMLSRPMEKAITKAGAARIRSRSSAATCRPSLCLTNTPWPVSPRRCCAVRV